MGKAKPVLVHDINIIPVGQDPILDIKGKFRPWQNDALEKAEGHKQAAFISPTGAGKSPVAMARGAIRMGQDKSYRHLVTIPQTIIAGSFAFLKFDLEWPGLGQLLWWPDFKIDASSYSVNSLKAWITEDHNGDTTYVCTHAALVAAFKEIADEGLLDKFAKVMLTIDEAHHSSVSELEEDEEAGTYLGDVVEHYFANDLYLDMFTATWFRTDSLNLIPKKYKEGTDYVKCVRHIDDHMREMTYLKEVVIRIVQGKPDAIVKYLCEEGTPKTIIYLSPTTSFTTKQSGGKKKLTSSLTKALKPFDLSVLDLVTVDGRDQREAAFLKHPEETDVMLALNKGIEGMDWDIAVRAVVLNSRKSMQGMVQRLGRVLRDVKGKTKAEFVIVIPDYEDETLSEKISNYVHTMVFSLFVGWNFNTPKLTQDSQRKVNEKWAKDPARLREDIGTGHDALLDANEADNAREVIEVALNDSHPEEAGEFNKSKAAMLAHMFSGSKSAVEDVPYKIETVEDCTKGIRSFAFKFGHKTLSDIRKALGEATPLTHEIILSDMDAFYPLHEGWPMSHDLRPVPNKPDESWVGYQTALHSGGRGLEPGWTIVKLLAAYRGVKNQKDSDITEDKIVEYIKKFVALHGRPPYSNDKAPVPDAPYEKWSNLDSCLRQGLRSLHGGSSLADLAYRKLGLGYKNMPYKPIDEARKFARANSITSGNAWHAIQKPAGIPDNVTRVYKTTWCGFFEKPPKGHFRSLKEARKWAKDNGITSYQEWRLAERPADIPCDPSRQYEMSNYEFFGRKDPRG